MLLGTVTPDGTEALLFVEVLFPSGRRRARVEAVIDTGFTGELSLHPEMIELLSLPVVGSAESVLADSSVVIEDVCSARAVWHGRERAVRVLVSEGTPLVGMALLRGSDLRIRVVESGTVEIEELP